MGAGGSAGGGGGPMGGGGQGTFQSSCCIYTALPHGMVLHPKGTSHNDVPDVLPQWCNAVLNAVA